MGKYRTGRLITVDGIDGVGKNTQSTKLRDYIKEVQGDCGFFSFPRYESPTGKLVGEYLRSGRDDLNLLQRAELYSNDRAAARLEILDYLMRGVDVVCDRYVDSNLAFFSSFAKMAQQENENVSLQYDLQVVQFIMDLEYKQLHLPRPDLTFILSMTPDKARELIEKKEKRNYTDATFDLHEGNKTLLELTSNFYNLHAITHGNHYNLIDCLNAQNNTIRTVEDIHEEIVGKYTERFRTRALTT